MNWDNKYSNLIAAPKGTSLNYRSGPGTTFSVIGNSKQGYSKGRTSGNYIDKTDGRWLQVTLNPPSQKTAYVREDVTKLIIPKTNTISDADAKNIVDKLVSSDIQVHESLIRSGNLLSSAKEKGLNIEKQLITYKNLLDRFNSRQEKIKKSKIVKWKTGLKNTYKALVNTFSLFLKTVYGMRISGVTLTVAVMYATIGAGLATAAYFVFRPSYNESQEDLKISNDLEQLLKKADPQTAQKIIKDLEGQVDTAYNTGRTQGTFTGMFKTIKPLVFALAGFFFITKFVDTQKPKK